MEVYRTLDLVVPEQATDVPKSTQDGIRQRLVDQDLRQAQMAEQLVEMPEFVQFASMLQQQRAEQIVNIPVPGGSGILVEVLKVSSQDRDQWLLPQWIALPLWERHLKGFFALFPHFKKVQSPAASAEMTRQVEFSTLGSRQVAHAGVAAHSSSWTQAAYELEESSSSSEEDHRVDEYGRTWVAAAAFLEVVLARPQQGWGWSDEPG